MRGLKADIKISLILSIVILLFSIIINNGYSLLSIAMTVTIASSCVYICCILMIYKADDKYINSLYKLLCIVFAGVGLIAVSYLYVLRQGVDFTTVVPQLGRSFFMCMIYEPLACVIVFKIHDKKVNVKLFAYINALIVGIIIYSSLYIDSNLFDKFIGDELNLYKAAMNMFQIMLYVYMYYNIKKNSNIINKEIYRCFSLYIGTRILMHVCIFLPIDLLNFKIFILLILRTISTYFILKIMILEVIRSPQEILYRDLDYKSKDLQKAVDDLRIAKRDVEIEAEKSRVILKNLPSGIVIIEDEKIIYVNDEILNMFKINEYRQILGMNFLELIDKKDHKLVTKAISNINKKGKEYGIDLKFKFNDVQVYGEIRGISIVYSDDDHRQYLFMIRDITDRKELERVEELLKEKQRNEVIKNELLTNISHEFKTPVNVIYSAIQMQELRRADDNVTDILKYNKTIKQNCYRLIRLINNFIDTTRFEQEGVSADLGYLNIVNLTEDTTMSVLSFAESSGIKIIFDTTEEEIVVLADRQLMERVLLNLLSNAIKYSIKEGTIFVSVDSDAENVYINITDNGIGIPDEKQHLLFNRFERIDKSLSRSKEGSGLGLNIVKKIIEIHNGHINLESKIGKGTKVTVSIPRVLDKKLIEENYKVIVQSDYGNSYNVELEMSDIYL